jgi:hypothetical protein
MLRLRISNQRGKLYCVRARYKFLDSFDSFILYHAHHTCVQGCLIFDICFVTKQVAIDGGGEFDQVGAGANTIREMKRFVKPWLLSLLENGATYTLRNLQPKPNDFIPDVNPL